MMRYALLVCAFMTTLARESEACSRCGLFGNRCRFVQQQTSYPVAVAPVTQYKSPDVFVVQNNYPAPNGAAALLAQQGSTVYQGGYQSAAQAYALNPADVIRQASELTKAAQLLAGDGLKGFNQVASTALALQASSAEPLIKSKAAVDVLNAAGLSQQLTQPQSLAIRISRGSDGQWQVTQADPAAVSERLEVKVEPKSPAPMVTPEVEIQPASSAKPSVINAKCGSCHGLNLTEPKGGIYLGSEHKLNCKAVLRSLTLIKADKMPKDSKLTPEEKGAILDELLSLSQEE